ncbi:MAG: hypothetical protein WC223_01090 [Bacteroidales bacterium]|jgi:hypothetical protein
MKTAAFIMAMLVSTSIFAQGAKKSTALNTQGPIIVNVDDGPIIPPPPPIIPPLG